METKITARYEDAIKFIQNDIKKSAEDALLLNIKFGIPSKFVAGIQGQKVLEHCKILAFIYGMTKEEVADDIIKATEELKGRASC